MFARIRFPLISAAGLTLSVAWPPVCAEAQNVSLANLQTRAERTNYEETSTYEDVQQFLDQPLGRLAFTLLEPRSDDGLLNWNVLDALVADAEEYPILSTFGTLRAF